MGRTALGLTLALVLAAGCGGNAAGPQVDAGLPGQDAQRDLAPPEDAALDGVPDAAPDVPGQDARDGAATGDASDGPDGSPSDGPTDAKVDGGCGLVSLLENGGFESGSAGWTEESRGGYALVYATADLPVAPQAGGYAAWLGGYDYADDLLWQEVAVPAGATSLRLTGYRSLATQETGTYPWDYVYVELRDPADTVLETLLSYSNLDAITGWQAFQATAQTAHAGTTIRVAFAATTDAISDPTNFFFDTLALEATVCP